VFFNQDDYLLVIHHEALAAKLISIVFARTSARKPLAAGMASASRQCGSGRAGCGVE
jgi:hypothetical protein